MSVIEGNILSREFIFAPHGFRAYALIEDDADGLADAVRCAPLYLGDSEGLVSIHDSELADARKCDGAGSVAVYFPAGWAKIRVLGEPDKEGVSLFPVNRWQKPHDWSMGGDATKKRKGKKRGNLLEQYCFPIVRRGRFVVPTRPAVEEWLVEVAFFKASDGEILPFASNGK
ncbi:MAG TPA: hypothetical protein ENF73_01855 [Proteobacteria bacterium]|nr:hypothetical protein [Pseudomonadota bacterium]